MAFLKVEKMSVTLSTMPINGGIAKTIAYIYGGQGTINVPSWLPDLIELPWLLIRNYRKSLYIQIINTKFKSMRTLLSFLFLIYSMNLTAQQDSIAGKVYVFKNMPQTVDNNRIYTPIINAGSTTHFANFRVHHSTLKPGHQLRPAHTQKTDEELIIVKEGKLSVTINGKNKVLGVGSVFVIMPGDEQTINNLDSNPASYYVFIYRSKAPKDSLRAVSAGGSMMIDWNDVTLKPNEKGGRRDFFNRPTAMCKRLEMHVTSLNQGLKSHELHKHSAEEIILLVQGSAKEQIGDKFYEGTAGDLFFLPSNVFHNITNTGEGQAVYYAFQFE